MRSARSAKLKGQHEAVYNAETDAGGIDDRQRIDTGEKGIAPAPQEANIEAAAIGGDQPGQIEDGVITALEDDEGVGRRLLEAAQGVQRRCNAKAQG